MSTRYSNYLVYGEVHRHPRSSRMSGRPPAGFFIGRAGQVVLQLEVFTGSVSPDFRRRQNEFVKMTGK